MFTKLFFLALVLATTPFILADLSINNPVAGTIWTQSQPATVSWIPAGSGLSSTGDTIDLLKGDVNALTLIDTLTSNYPETNGAFKFNVSPTYADGGDYCVRVGTFYSHLFTISQNGTNLSSPNAGAPTGTPVVSPTGAPSGAPTGTPTGTPTAGSATGLPTSTSVSSGVRVVTSMAALIPVVVMALVWF